MTFKSSKSSIAKVQNLIAEMKGSVKDFRQLSSAVTDESLGSEGIMEILDFFHEYCGNKFMYDFSKSKKLDSSESNNSSKKGLIDTPKLDESLKLSELSYPDFSRLFYELVDNVLDIFEIKNEDFLDVQVRALTFLMYMTAKSVPLSSHISQGSITLNTELLSYIVKRLLVAGGPECASLYSSSSLPASTLRHYTADLSMTRRTFRREFCDDYDDIRFQTLRILKDLISRRESVVRKPDLIQKQSPIDRLFLGCNMDVIVRNATDFLIVLEFPHDASTWRTGDHASWAFDEVGEETDEFGAARGHKPLVCPVSVDLSQVESATAAENDALENEIFDRLTGKSDSSNGTKRGAKFLSVDSDDENGAPSKRPRNSGKAEDLDSGDESDFKDPYLDEESGASNTLEGELRVPGSGGVSVFTSELTVEEQLREKKAKLREAKIRQLESILPRFAQFNEQRKALGEAWLAVLRLPQPPDVLRRVLIALPGKIIPRLSPSQSLLLSDYLTSACDAGGANALLALQALFSLMQNHGLEYPRFYTLLYALLNETTVRAKYRSRFLVLLDMFLASPALPAYLVAAFAKRLARLSLTAPVGFVMYVIPAIYNLMKRHPSIQMLIQREPYNPSLAGRLLPPQQTATVRKTEYLRLKQAFLGTAGADTANAASVFFPNSSDPFDATTLDPAKTRALESSLWELNALQQHFHAPVANLARSLSGEAAASLSKQEFDVSAYASSTYVDMLEDELNRVVKKEGKEVKVAPVFDFEATSVIFNEAKDSEWGVEVKKDAFFGRLPQEKEGTKALDRIFVI